MIDVEKHECHLNDHDMAFEDITENISCIRDQIIYVNKKANKNRSIITWLAIGLFSSVAFNMVMFIHILMR